MDLSDEYIFDIYRRISRTTGIKGTRYINHIVPSMLFINEFFPHEKRKALIDHAIRYEKQEFYYFILDWIKTNIYFAENNTDIKWLKKHKRDKITVRALIEHIKKEKKMVRKRIILRDIMNVFGIKHFSSSPDPMEFDDERCEGYCEGYCCVII